MTKSQRKLVAKGKLLNAAYLRGSVSRQGEIELLNNTIHQLRKDKERLQSSLGIQERQAQINVLNSLAAIAESATKAMLSFNNHL